MSADEKGGGVTPAVEKVRTWIDWVVYVVAATVVLAVITWQVTIYKADPQAATASQQKAVTGSQVVPPADPSLWPGKWTIPAGGKSESVLGPVGTRILMNGSGFKNHTVYQDGTDCAYNGTSPCPNGAVVGNYASNETNSEIVVRYIFVPIN